jgi:cytochrome c553
VPTTSLFALLASLLPQGGAPVDFARDIQPIFAAKCVSCHGPKKHKGDLRLDSLERALEGSPGGKVIVRGDANASDLYQRLITADAMDRMPQKEPALPAAEIELIRRWIDGDAAAAPSAPSAPAKRVHWAYVAPVEPPTPDVKNRAWIRNPIDRFVLARLEKEGLAPSPEAPKGKLLRRVSLDLTGIPPTAAELDAFERDADRDAYERAVDRLLASKRYAERMAQGWLDLARYADTNGYEKDGRRSLWPWRDWVIDAFDCDMPFEQFTVEQLAGDLLPDATLAAKVATGFHRNTLVNQEGGTDPEEFRFAAVVDRVNTTAAVWLGTTLACAQCHDHKYDPFPQKDYYRFAAFFDSTADVGNATAPEVRVPTAEQARELAAREEEAARSLSMLASAYSDGGTGPVLRVLAAVAGGKQARRDEFLASIPTTMVLEELREPRATHVAIKGNFRNPGEAVARGVPGVLPDLPPDAPRNRLGLARWLASPANPLTARVVVNRAWERLFGRGLVATSEDFGVRGDPPSHPELLDWLALDFLASGGSFKSLARRIVTSATYRQDSRATPELLERDREDRLLARAPRVRLEVETLRDAALAIGGILVEKVGGPSVFPPQPEGVFGSVYSDDAWKTSSGGDAHRRGLYTFWKRSAPYATFAIFDAPSRELVCTRRPRTDTPLQALATLNDPVFVECATALARRMEAEGGSSPESRVRYGFRLCTGRSPEPAEAAVLVDLGNLDRAASVLLNLDETLTRD